MKTLTFFLVWILLGGLLAAKVSYADETTINYKCHHVLNVMAF